MFVSRFNVIKSLSETFGEDEVWDSDMEDFKLCMESLALEDLRSTYVHYTGWNSQEHLLFIA